MFGSWTTLPAGRPLLAAKHGSAIVPFSINRQPDGTFRAAADDPILVPSDSPADLAIATQKIADALEGHIAPAPEQWYIFKPIWPATAEEAARLEARHRAAMANDARGAAPNGGPARSPRTAMRLGGAGEMTGPASPAAGEPPARRPGLRRRFADGVTAVVAIGAMKLVLHLPERLVWALADVAGGVSYRVARTRRDRARRNLRRVVEWMAANGRGDEPYRAAATDPRALEALVRSAFGNHARYYVELARAPRLHRRAGSASGSSSRRPTQSTRR